MNGLPGAIVLLLALGALLTGLVPGPAVRPVEPLDPELLRQMREKISVRAITAEPIAVKLGEADVRRVSEMLRRGSSPGDALRAVYPDFDALGDSERRWLESTISNYVRDGENRQLTARLVWCGRGQRGGCIRPGTGPPGRQPCVRGSYQEVRTIGLRDRKHSSEPRACHVPCELLAKRRVHQNRSIAERDHPIPVGRCHRRPSLRWARRSKAPRRLAALPRESPLLPVKKGERLADARAAPEHLPDGNAVDARRVSVSRGIVSGHHPCPRDRALFRQGRSGRSLASEPQPRGSFRHRNRLP